MAKGSDEKGANVNTSRFLGRYISIVFALSSFVFLLFTNIIKPAFLDGFLDKYATFSQRSLIDFSIAIIGILMAYHCILTFIIDNQRNILSEKVEDSFSQMSKATEKSFNTLDSRFDAINNQFEIVNDQFKTVNNRLDTVITAVPFSQLAIIEEKHGLSNAEKRNHVVDLTNRLQESHGGNSGDEFLEAIYKNIMTNGVEYYYVLPNNKKGAKEIALLADRLRKYKKAHKDKRSPNGGVHYLLDNSMLEYMPSEYYDTILYVDFIEDEKQQGEVVRDVEGYYCFSKERKDNNYFFAPMSGYRAENLYDTWINKRDKFIKMEI